nr:hypothetical protein [uncultured Schaedlerella sp.]
MERNHISFGFCNMSGKLFVLANEKGYESEAFIESLMNSQVGEHLYHSPYTDLWIGETYIMAVLEDEVELRTGVCLSDDFMYWTGYLFKVWSLTYPEETAKDMLMQAPPETLRQMFGGLHVMSYEQAILELKELYESKSNI